VPGAESACVGGGCGAAAAAARLCGGGISRGTGSVLGAASLEWSEPPAACPLPVDVGEIPATAARDGDAGVIVV